MKISTLQIFISCTCIFVRVIAVNGESLKTCYGNSINNFRVQQRKPWASPIGNSLQEDNYKRTKRQVIRAIQNFQQVLSAAKLECVKELNMNLKMFEKSFMYEEYPTAQEKCLLMCILKKTKLMKNSQKLSVKNIGRLADAISNSNPLVVSVAKAAADNCNNLIRAQEPCEAAYQINKCIGSELKTHKLRVFY